MATGGVWRQLVFFAPVQNGGLVVPGAFQVLRQGSAGDLRQSGTSVGLVGNRVFGSVGLGWLRMGSAVVDYSTGRRDHGCLPGAFEPLHPSQPHKHWISLGPDPLQKPLQIVTGRVTKQA